MNKNTGVGILLIAVVLGGAWLLFQYQKDYVWHENYTITEDQPYYTSVFLELMEDKDPHHLHSTFEDYFEDNQDSNSSIFFLGRNFYLNDSTDFELFMNHLKKGNKAFIVCQDIASESKYIPAKLKSKEEEENEWEEEQWKKNTGKYVSRNLIHDEFSLSNYNERDSVTKHVILGENTEFTFRKVNYYEGEKFSRNLEYKCYYPNEIYKTVGTTNKLNTFIKIKVGKGELFIMTTPILFTNKPLIREEGFNYINKVLEKVNLGSKIIYDHRHNRPINDFEKNSKQQSNKRDGGRDIDTPFSFVFDRIGLRMAWYGFLTTILLYIVFYLRRKQRVIPLIYPRKNKSLEFAKSIGLLYLLSNHHKYIVRYQMRHFLMFVRKKYRLNLRTDQTEDFEHLAMKSQVDIEKIKDLFSYYQKLRKAPELNDKQLLLFNRKVSTFYKTCK